ncbi:MAG: iron-sulfur cluster-binding domain-containing protein [Cyanobacteria bacterium P01_C01_bin.72]
MHDHLLVGDWIKLIGGAMGKFTCTTQPPRKILLISAGSGITPMISMTRWIYDTVADCDVVFFHNARTPQDIILRQELETLAARQSNFRLAISVTRPELIQPWQSQWLGLTGRFNETMLNNIAPDFTERTVYVCGSDGFMQQVKSILASQDFPMEQYHQESFGGKKPKQKQASPALVAKPSIEDIPDTETIDRKSNSQKANTTNQPAVFFSELGKEIPCDEEESILEVAEQHGVAIRSACRQGVCGACKVHKIEGEVRYEGDPDALSDHDEGCILPCIAFPVGKVTIQV